jgi:hypothetical protein
MKNKEPANTGFYYIARRCWWTSHIPTGSKTLGEKEKKKESPKFSETLQV